jgi:hypothetical protein
VSDVILAGSLHFLLSCGIVGLVLSLRRQRSMNDVIIQLAYNFAITLFFVYVIWHLGSENRITKCGAAIGMGLNAVAVACFLFFSSHACTVVTASALFFGGILAAFLVVMAGRMGFSVSQENSRYLAQGVVSGSWMVALVVGMTPVSVNAWGRLQGYLLNFY